jgi:hypothetical protein
MSTAKEKTLAEVKGNLRDALTLTVDYIREKAKREGSGMKIIMTGVSETRNREE